VLAFNSDQYVPTNDFGISQLVKNFDTAEVATMLGLPIEEMAAIQEGLVEVAGAVSPILLSTEDPPPAQPWPTPASNVSPYNPTWWVQWPRVSGLGFMVQGAGAAQPRPRPASNVQPYNPTWWVQLLCRAWLPSKLNST